MTRFSLEYAVRKIHPRINSALKNGLRYLAREEFKGAAAKDCEVVRKGLSPDGREYSDDGVRPLVEH